MRVRLGCLVIVPSWVACSGSGTDAVSWPTAWEYEAVAQEDAVDPAVIQAEVQGLLANVRSFNARPALEAYDQARLYGDSLCPEEVTTETVESGTSVYFERLCVARRTYWYKGPMTTYAFAENLLEQFEVYDFFQYMDFDGTKWTGSAMKGQTDIFSSGAAEPVDYNCSCTAMAAVSPPSATSHQWLSYTDGPTHWTAPEALDSWINQGIQSHLYMKFGTRPLDARWRAEIVGSVTGFATVYGDIELDLALGGDLLADGGVACDADGGGTIAARHTTTGLRTTLTYSTPGGSCEACVTVEGEEVCVDFAALMVWDTTPW